MARWIDADDAIARIRKLWNKDEPIEEAYIYDDYAFGLMDAIDAVEDSPDISIVRCQDCKKSHIDGKTTHYLWCTEWGRSTDTFGFCERGEREGE